VGASAVILVLMGVAGAGKTTVGRMLADALGFRFHDADDFHPRANVDKMRRGMPLDDADRAPWLAALAGAIDGWLRDGDGVVLACSALKAAYRAALLRDPARVAFLYLRVPAEVARERVAGRAGHFLKADLVDSHLRTLEEPAGAITVDAAAPPEVIVARLRAALGR
jgi:gluconokinase